MFHLLTGPCHCDRIERETRGSQNKQRGSHRSVAEHGETPHDHHKDLHAQHQQAAKTVRQTANWPLPDNTIEKRLCAAAEADFVICLYNPSSRKRSTYLAKACEIMLEYKAEDTVCGIVKNIAREGETMQTLTLKELKETTVDMFSTVFIGNKQTKVIREKMVTPRGYRI